MFEASGDQFTAILASADVSQAAFARLTGVTARQVNKWCRGRAKIPAWAVLLAVVLQQHSAESLAISAEEVLGRLRITPTEYT